MKRFITIATSAVIMAVGGTMLATPAQAASRALAACSDEQIDIIIAVSDAICDGGDWTTVASCGADGSISGSTTCE